MARMSSCAWGQRYHERCPAQDRSPWADSLTLRIRHPQVWRQAVFGEFFVREALRLDQILVDRQVK
jgi:hypothetical protein